MELEGGEADRWTPHFEKSGRLWQASKENMRHEGLLQQLSPCAESGLCPGL